MALKLQNIYFAHLISRENILCWTSKVKEKETEQAVLSSIVRAKLLLFHVFKMTSSFLEAPPFKTAQRDTIGQTRCQSNKHGRAF